MPANRTRWSDQRPKEQQHLRNGDRYDVVYIRTEAIEPSPENDELYGGLGDDETLHALTESIQDRGLEEPLILTADGFILSGHRRFAVCRALGMKLIPCRVKRDIRRLGNPSFKKDLMAYNPQRVKSAGALLREAILRDSTTLEDTQAAIRRVNSTMKPTGSPSYERVAGRKSVKEISPRGMEFLAAVRRVVERLRAYWPLSIRQVHYQLLNAPPLKLTPERSRYNLEHYRYRNDLASYSALSDLCTQARYKGRFRGSRSTTSRARKAGSRGISPSPNS